MTFLYSAIPFKGISLHYIYSLSPFVPSPTSPHLFPPSLLSFWERVSLILSGSPGIHYVVQAGLEFSAPPASAFQCWNWRSSLSHLALYIFSHRRFVRDQIFPRKIILKSILVIQVFVTWLPVYYVFLTLRFSLKVEDISSRSPWALGSPWATAKLCLKHS